ncbi:tRNA (adenosine(37)-N6)-threonylcarbamoyltransferase complex transferase subunit TsaD [Hyphomicrobium sp. LHD-15]|nr:tRNA (adenosine(37)-N6)-threonylcarbamoyltransferase complex transferase subunit TsaD [Hyphomicrobium sp. LHD-15]MDQ8698498.1 tRNA (adenosine(37)-N6)-threonylcarbamoyltransferase complex transferase subunit TsaD [Hyphomicrobium sp. LHD-15]
MPDEDSKSGHSGQPLVVLGIETSCDETAAAIVLREADGRGRVLSNVVRSQFDEHRPYGGVVPEIAARAHVECLDAIIKAALAEANVGLADLSGIAATAGPGLNGGLVVGLVTGKTLALAADKPFLAINHLEAHALTVGLTDGIAPPYLMLLVSGGHTQTLLVEGVGRYRRLGTTIDDAIGEAFDKTAKLLGLGYPGGPEVEKAARAGDPSRFPLPRPMLGRAEPHFSLAGLKTALRQRAEAAAPLSDQDIADLCAAFEAAVCDVVSDRVGRAMEMAAGAFTPGQQKWLTIAGGVAANRKIAVALSTLAEARGYRLAVPPPSLCTDNGAMIAWAGAERLALGLVDGLDFAAKPRWPLDPDAPAAIGAGVKA